jgi:transcriptional regulator GlxA family with amidase domain
MAGETVNAASVRIAILTFEGFNEIDSLVSYHILNRVRRPGWEVQIASPTPRVRSMNGLVIEAQATLAEVHRADAVVVGSGTATRSLAEDVVLLEQLCLDPAHQLVASQCSGALLLARLGLLKGTPACTDLKTRPWLEQSGVEVLDRPFHAAGNVATAGGCFASQYLAAWLLLRLTDVDTASDALRYVAPVGEKESYVSRIMDNVRPYLPESVAA